MFDSQCFHLLLNPEVRTVTLFHIVIHAFKSLLVLAHTWSKLSINSSKFVKNCVEVNILSNLPLTQLLLNIVYQVILIPHQFAWLLFNQTVSGTFDTNPSYDPLHSVNLQFISAILDNLQHFLGFDDFATCISSRFLALFVLLIQWIDSVFCFLQ